MLQAVYCVYNKLLTLLGCFFRMMAKDELVVILEKCVEIITSSPSEHLKIPSEKLKQYLDQFRNLEGILYQFVLEI